MDMQTYLLFVATAAVLVLTPGPDTVLVLSRTLASGASAGLATLAGTQAGNVVHAVLAGVGVSTVVLLFPVALHALKVAGIAYLLVLAVQAWRAPATLALRPRAGGTVGRHFLQGLANNLANPKMIVFFLALFPQFVRPGQGSLAVQSLVLGATLAAMALAWIGFVVLLVARFRAAFVASPAFLRVVQRLAAATFVGLAARLTLEDVP
jgi:threonine/homoserine/homoserine lactone efflux protein